MNQILVIMNRTAEKIDWEENHLSTTQLSEKLIESIQTSAQETIWKKQRTESKHIWKYYEELFSIIEARKPFKINLHTAVPT